MKEQCEHCGGTGVHSYFKGKSRFLLSQDECQACCGLGFIETADQGPEEATDFGAGPGATEAHNARGGHRPADPRPPDTP
jgi:hypothetical protein